MRKIRPRGFLVNGTFDIHFTADLILQSAERFTVLLDFEDYTYKISAIVTAPLNDQQVTAKQSVASNYGNGDSPNTNLPQQALTKNPPKSS